VERLKTIPGIGEFFAMLIRHEIDKIERFPKGPLCSPPNVPMNWERS
jgi:transposase